MHRPRADFALPPRCPPVRIVFFVFGLAIGDRMTLRVSASCIWTDAFRGHWQLIGIKELPLLKFILKMAPKKPEYNVVILPCSWNLKQVSEQQTARVQNRKRSDMFLLLSSAVFRQYRYLKTCTAFVLNNQLDPQFFFLIHFISLHVSSSVVLIIMRVSCINTSGICHSLCACLCRFGWNWSSIQTSISYGHLHTRCIDTIDCPDGEHKAARNM